MARDILDSLVLERLAETRFRGPSVPDERRPVVFGGQIMGQMIVAASACQPQKAVKSLHVVFARAGSVEFPVEVELDPLHEGRAFASFGVCARQGERVLSRGTLLLDAGEPDVIRHQTPTLPVGSPEEAPEVEAMDHPGIECRIADGVDLMTAAATGPPEVHVWVRFQRVPDDPVLHQALLSWYTDPFLIAAAMRPHEGIGQIHAHETLSTGVIAHTLTFHEPVRADAWLLFSNRSLHAGGGRSYGEGHVFTEDGRLVASYVQENMIRRFRDDVAVRGKRTAAL